jgi:hypothetical protein
LLEAPLVCCTMHIPRAVRFSDDSSPAGTGSVGMTGGGVPPPPPTTGGGVPSSGAGDTPGARGGSL